jgi:hypothetical protein
LEKGPNSCQRNVQELEVLDGPKLQEVVGPVEAKTARTSGYRLNEAHLLIVADGPWANPRQAGKLTHLEIA